MNSHRHSSVSSSSSCNHGSTSSSSLSSGGSGGEGTKFGRRPDYSTFNSLPRTKINSYHIRMEDETSHGNDNIRTLILSTLSSNGMNRVHCILCNSSMPIFERFPLIDGTFFLSPRQHSPAAVQIVRASIERKFLNAVCMGCMEGWNASLRCRSCRVQWDGSHLILGSMYSYDIFAAVPCCLSRLKCARCGNLAIPPGRRLEFFSDYSQNLACAACSLKDFHFVKPLTVMFAPSNAPGSNLVLQSGDNSIPMSSSPDSCSPCNGAGGAGGGGGVGGVGGAEEESGSSSGDSTSSSNAKRTSVKQPARRRRRRGPRHHAF